MEKRGYVYIMANKRNGTLYIGVTSNLVQRVWQHRNGAIDGFTKKYGCKRLVWYAVFGDIVSAIAQEKAIKFWRRSLKLTYIERMNPEWRDLWDDIARI